MERNCPKSKKDYLAPIRVEINTAIKRADDELVERMR